MCPNGGDPPPFDMGNADTEICGQRADTGGRPYGSALANTSGRLMLIR